MESLPSVRGFAEWQMSTNRQIFSLPSAALDKEKHSAKESFAEC